MLKLQFSSNNNNNTSTHSIEGSGTSVRPRNLAKLEAGIESRKVGDTTQLPLLTFVPLSPFAPSYLFSPYDFRKMINYLSNN